MSSRSATRPPTIDPIAFDRDGFAIVPDVVSPTRIRELLGALPPMDGREARGGIRNLFDVPAVMELVRNSAMVGIARLVLGPECFAVRALLFDKTVSANWKVAWHQDLTIAVAEYRDVPGFGPWSRKAGVLHVQPPTEILDRMVAVRLHLDACTHENGPVRVLPGSHRVGTIPATAIDAWRGSVESVTCVVPQGGVLVMRPLLLHASSPATVPAHRRVMHVELATGALPHNLAWRWQV